MRLKIFSDGGSRNNPGHAAYGYVIYDENDKVLFEEGKYIGINTNNVAEYSGILEGLKKAKAFAKDHELSAVDCYLDSNLIVQQMNGKFKIKAQHLLPLVAEIRETIKSLPKVTFNHVYREKNKAADALVNKALDAHQT